MSRRTLLFVAVLVAAVILPYFLANDQWSDTAKARWGTFFGKAADDRSADQPTAAIGTLGSGQPLPSGHVANNAHGPAGDVIQLPRLAGPPVQSMADVLRFDINPSWVTSNWSRVTTMVGDLELEGLRVPLVTGTEVHDLAGSLTYYFDKQRQVQRVRFQGTTGDQHPLVALVSQTFGLQHEPALGAGLYLARWNRKPTSILRVRHAPVVRADDPHQRLEVLLELNRPNANYGLSREMETLLTEDRRAGRW